MAFNPESFASAVVDGAMSTRLTPVPIGEYTAIIEKVTARPTNEKGSTPCDIIYDLQDDALKLQMGRPKITSRGNVWLDITPSGGLDNGEGKNTGLGRVREACGQNDPSKPWSPSMLIGQMVRVKVTQSINPKDGETYDNVTGVTKA
jgi:hypothetical protein